MEKHHVLPRVVLIRKRELTIRLQKVGQHPRPKVILEQYTIPSDIAAEILFSACYARADIEGKSVADLGTGTGRLALGASMLGAQYVVGIDLDPSALDAAHRNSERLGTQVDWVLGDIEALKGPVDTVLMNPPFGTRQPHADLQFLEVALSIGSVVYSIHKLSTRSFLLSWLRRHAAKAEVIMTTKMEIPHLFSFHRKKRHYVNVDIFRIERE